MIGFTGSPRKGYAVDELIGAVNAVLAQSVETSVALVGVGNLGRAILAYYTNRQPWVRFVAAFDRDPDKANRIIHGCRVFPFDQAADVLGREARVESFFDGIEPALIRDELRAAEARVLGPERGEADLAEGLPSRAFKNAGRGRGRLVHTKR